MPVVTPPEEIGARNADRLRVILLEAAARGRARLVVDMTGTRFCASAGISELIRAHKRALAESGELRPVIPATGDVWRRGQSGDPRAGRPCLESHQRPSSLDQAVVVAVASLERTRTRGALGSCGWGMA